MSDVPSDPMSAPEDPGVGLRPSVPPGAVPGVAPHVLESEPDPASPAIDGAGPGMRRIRDRDGRTVATVLGGNPLDEAWTPPPSEEVEGDLVVWSGSLAPDLLAVHPHTWMQPGRDRLAERVEWLLPRVPEGRRLLLRAHARQVLSDPPSVRAFLRERTGLPVGLLLEPAAVFEASMLGRDVEDHVDRVLSGLGDLAAMLLLGDVAAGDPVDGDGDDAAVVPRLVAPGRGRLPADALARAIKRWVAPAVPRVVRAEHAGGA